MEKRNARLLVVLASLLFMLALIIYWYTDTYSTFRSSEIDFSVGKSASITRIELGIPVENEQVVLTKDQQERWRLNSDYYANDAAVRQLMDVLSHLTVWQPASLSVNDSISDLLDKQGTLVKVFIRSHYVDFGKFKLFPHERLYQSLLVGDDAPDGESTYMKKYGATKVFRVLHPGYQSGISFIFDSREKVWRDPVIIDASWEEIAQVSVEFTEWPGESYILKNEETGEYGFYSFTNPEQPLDTINTDPERVERYMASFSQIYYESLLDEEGENLRKEIINREPFLKLNVLMKDSTSVSIEAFSRRLPPGAGEEGVTDTDPNRFYIRVNDGEYALAQYYIFNRIMRPLSFFKNKKVNNATD